MSCTLRVNKMLFINLNTKEFHSSLITFTAPDSSSLRPLRSSDLSAAAGKREREKKREKPMKNKLKT